MNPADPRTLPVWGLVGVRASQSAYGLCFECALHWWFSTVDGLRWAFQEDGPALLGMPVVQALILSVFEPPPVVDWSRLCANWNRAWPADWPLSRDGFNG